MLVTLICQPDASTPKITGQGEQNNIYVSLYISLWLTE